jgi:hypothetical protein
LLKVTVIASFKTTSKLTIHRLLSALPAAREGNHGFIYTVARHKHIIYQECILQEAFLMA